MDIPPPADRTLSSKWIYAQYLSTNNLNFQDAQYQPNMMQLVDQYGDDGIDSHDVDEAMAVPNNEEQYYIMQAQFAELPKCHRA